MTDEKQSGIPVYACSRGDLKGVDVPIGYAMTAGEAAKILRKFLSERDGDDYGLRASDIYYSRNLNAYFTEE